MSPHTPAPSFAEERQMQIDNILIEMEQNQDSFGIWVQVCPSQKLLLCNSYQMETAQ